MATKLAQQVLLDCLKSVVTLIIGLEPVLLYYIHNFVTEPGFNKVVSLYHCIIDVRVEMSVFYIFRG